MCCSVFTLGHAHFHGCPSPAPSTCHVTCLFNTGSDQPHAFHGNTCAHNLNFVLTATVLPRVPADIKGMLSVIFIGSRQPLKESEDSVPHKKRQAWEFLTWLAENNPLYTKIKLSEAHLRLYKNDEIPDMEEHVMECKTASAERNFEQETAGVEPHFAMEYASSIGTQDDLQEPLLECMGVSDVESVKIQGCTFQAAASMNLNQPPNEKPDLSIFSGSEAIGEYNDSNLLMGMFPTLFPYGKGGFEVPVSFEM